MLAHLQLLDSALPVGIFAQSFGLESAVQAERVRDETSLRNWLETLLFNSWAPCDMMPICALYNGTDEDELWHLERLIFASRTARESRHAQQKIGRRWLGLAREIVPDANWQALQLAQKSGVPLSPALIYGHACRHLQVSRADALDGFLYGNIVSSVNNAVRLLLIGQTRGQVIVAQMLPLIEQARTEFESQTPFDFWTNVPMAEIDAMNHETLYSRLFMSQLITEFTMDEEEKWQQFEEGVKQAEWKQERRHPDLFVLRSIGCLVGGLLGPLLLFAFIALASIIYPHNGGSPVMFLLWMLITIPIGGGLGALLIPFVVKWINNFTSRNKK